MITLAIIWLLCMLVVSAVVLTVYIPITFIYSFGDAIGFLIELLVLIIFSPLILVVGVCYAVIYFILAAVEWLINKIKN